MPSTNIELNIPEIPHGHAKSFRKGIADGLLDDLEYQNQPHPTHNASYLRGYTVGKDLKLKVAALEKK